MLALSAAQSNRQPIVSVCSVFQLPREIGNLVSLQSLDVSHNKQLTTLPDELGRCTRLWEVSVCVCVLAYNFVCVCGCVCTCVWVCVCAQVGMHAWIHTCACAHTHTHTLIVVPTQTHTHTLTHTCTITHTYTLYTPLNTTLLIIVQSLPVPVSKTVS